MQILTISEVYPSSDKPQYGVFIKQQVDELVKLGNKIDVLRPLRSENNGQIVKESFAGIKIYSVEYKVNRYELFIRKTTKPVYLQIKELIKNNHYDLLAVHITSDTILKIIVDIGRELGVSVVAHYHGLNVWKEFVNKHRIREALYAHRRAKMLKKVKAIVGVSDKVCQIVREKKLKAPAFTVYNGVETNLFYKQEEKFEHFTIIGVGNLIPIKGFRYLIDAFSKLYQTDKDIRLKIVGEGVERSSLEAQVKNLGLERVVEFLGRLPYEQVAEKMRGSHLFVLPSYYEALGCVYLEAMACGVPTIGVKGMGIDEIIVDGENGLLVEQKDIESIVVQIKKVIEDKELAVKLSKNGRETALKYTWEQSAKQLDNVYKSTVEEG